ncbi:hypothetical protein [Methylocapsa palsarum]|uniref:hypothetical protein n=1 Tax=Methylocapsa palsarum TaxID=1612308 RepID=UPI0011139A2A|nr:hypothetical protein [Methylocapsa palsarum]
MQAVLRWRDLKDYSREKIAEKVYKISGRIYIAFALGLASRILAIEPEKFSALGLEFSVHNRNVIPGFFFVISVAFTIYFFMYILYFGLFLNFNNKEIFRLLIYRLSTTFRVVHGKTTILHTLKDKHISRVKKVAKFIFVVYSLSVLIYVLFPLIYIISLERDAVRAVIIQLFHFKGG